LDPLLRSTKGFENGDENDASTGYSPFPGNINQLLFKLDDYCQALDASKGLMPEFVNPKYADANKTIFKSPTRLECMMQDFPTILDKDNASRVGFTSISADLCFSPVKNATVDGVALQAQQTSPGTAASGVSVSSCYVVLVVCTFANGSRVV
jgi:UDP-sugar pyrophosphorylase